MIEVLKIFLFYTEESTHLLFQLSNPDEYEGGDFLIGDYRLPKDKGFCCLFDGGTQVHEVTKVTKGERKSWITWMPKESLTIF